MTSTTEHHEYADTTTLSRGQLISSLERARGRIATLTTMLDDTKGALAASRAEVAELRRRLAHIKRAVDNT